MKDKDYEADFPAGTTWKDRLFSLPFLVLGKTIELGIRITCRMKGHRFTNYPDYCERCHQHFPEYFEPGFTGLGPGKYKRPSKD